MFEPVISGLVSGLTVIIGIMVILKLYLKSSVFMDFLEDLLREISMNEDLQKQIYMGGGLLGQGVRSGLGLQKSGGKRGTWDAIVELGAMFMGQKPDLNNFFQSFSPSPSSGPTPSPNPELPDRRNRRDGVM